MSLGNEAKGESRFDAFKTWMGPPVPYRSERIAFIPSSVQDDAQALYIVDDGLQCILPAIQEVVTRYGPTMDFQITRDEWCEIIRRWKSMLRTIDEELISLETFQYNPDLVGWYLIIILERYGVDHRTGHQHYRRFLNEVISYLERHLDESDHIVLTGL